jgi:hypothetical protein
MKQNSRPSVRQVYKGRRGQILIFVVLSLTVFFGFTGLTIDIGHLYFSYSELQASSNAAALAGAQVLPNSSAVSTAIAYSAVSGGANAHSNLPNVTMASGYPKLLCLTTLTNAGIPCVAPASANAIAVKQQATVSLMFSGLFGFRSLTITSTATAGMRGSATGPYNVAIVVDSTQSMNDTDKDSQCNTTRIACALAGVQVLLQGLSPCPASLASCGATTKNSSGGGANVPNAVDRVSLFTFPAMEAGTASSDYTCSGSPTIEPYEFSGTTMFLPSTSTYQVVNWSSDYKSSDTASSLNSTSNLVEAAGANSKSAGCLQAIGGYGTYYAEIIYQAQAALVAEQSQYPNTQNVLIVLSDGDANATNSRTKSDLVAVAPDTLTSTGTYPSLTDQCQQAITAAQAATTAGTRVYTVAYGAEASGCTTDSGLTPCTTMQQMASNASTFFSDYTATGSSGSCISGARPTSNLNQIFTEIAGDLTDARLIPNSTQ